MTFEKPKTDRPRSLTDYLSDARVIQVIVQIVFITLLVAGLSIIWINVLGTLTQRRIFTSLEVLTPIAGFQVGEAPPTYDTTSTFGEAFQVGIINTLRIVSIGLVLSTVLGVLVGIFLLSRNWLIRTISKTYVEVLRNTPLLVQLYFWYFIGFLSLPPYRELISVPRESYAAIPYHHLWFVVVFFGLTLYARRVGYRPWMYGGAVLGVIVIEGALALSRLNLGNRADLLLGGVLTYLLGMVFLFTKRRWHYFALGFLALCLSTLLASLMFQFMYYLEVPLFPSPDAAITQVHPAIFLSNKGLAFPTIDFNQRFAEWAAFIAAGTALAIALWRYSGHVTETTGKPIPRGRLAVMSVVAAALIGWIIVTAQPVPETITYQVEDQAVTQPYDTALLESKLPPNVERENAWYPVKLVMPERGRNNYTKGIVVTPEYMGLLIGLVVYTSAFIAEIVRAGIQAVPYGQIEAARALGLSYSETLSLIILPQALRVIIPPLGNQYLNLAKNSSLAIAVAYADVYQVGLIFMNTSGQSLVAFTVIFLVYITMSLTISFVMNIANSYFQIVSR